MKSENVNSDCSVVVLNVIVTYMSWEGLFNLDFYDYAVELWDSATSSKLTCFKIKHI